MGRRHTRIRRMTLAVAIGVAMPAGALRVEAAWTISLTNETGRVLTSYEVNPSPPPARLPADTVPDGGNFNIDPAGFNPVFAWDGGISLAGTDPNGFFIGLGLTETPPLIQYKLFHYKVTPGTPGSDPALQPILLSEQVVEVTEGEILIVVDGTWSATIGTPSVAGACCALTGCSDVTSLAACSDGNLLNGRSCAPALCTTASETIGPGGGTIETPDGSVSVEFPPDCLSADTTITISPGVYPGRMYDIALRYEPGADFDVRLAYSFDPTTLDFCPEAELCMTFDLTALGLDPTDCDDLQFVHRDSFCGFDRDADCVTDADCPVGVLCLGGFRAVDVTCTCPAASSTGSCCGNINHFSDYILVSPVEGDGAGCPKNKGWWCGGGFTLSLPLMFVVLALAKARGAGFTRRRCAAA